ncbi:nucleoside triphosphate pyrophosphohydrolase [Tolumonas lignilytica]|uniref:nucleoside triphosphate pyrophosphohydrolase n=1 Tax=Tolumonas lignilytica TaxID=1283284 RepID=UPI0004B973C4|nr:nucleoside triphosphate pyrophosphohydrolase [Tolumonas lignilytica]
MSPTYPMQELLALMQQLRDPEKGCPWDKKQTLQSLTAYTIEEAYEVVESIEQNDLTGLKSELGDLLFQVVFYSQLAQEQGLFNFQDVVHTISEKLVRRHPHVFADKEFADTAAVNANWEAEKAKERQEKDAASTSVLDDIPQSLPALMRAAKIQKRCATVGFDWQELPPVIEKIHEELDEVLAEVNRPEVDKNALAEELGDLLFANVNLVRHLGFDPEKILRAGNHKFERRFRALEQTIHAQGRTVQACSLDELETVWQQVKQME